MQDAKKFVIIGAGGHARVVVDTILSIGLRISFVIRFGTVVIFPSRAATYCGDRISTPASLNTSKIS